MNRLIKANLDIKEKLVEYLLILTFIGVLFANKLTNFSKSINCWDGIFSIIANPYFILYIYIPISVIFVKCRFIKCNQSVLIRINKRTSIVKSNILSLIILNFIFVSSFIIVIFIVNLIFFGFSTDWSQAILKFQNKGVINFLYPNNFIFNFNPLSALFLNYSLLLLVNLMITMFRDLLLENVNNKKIVNIIIMVFLMFNYILYYLKPIGILGKISDYISITHISLIWYHDFGRALYTNIKLGYSFVFSIVIIILISIIRIRLSEK